MGVVLLGCSMSALLCWRSPLHVALEETVPCLWPQKLRATTVFLPSSDIHTLARDPGSAG